MPLKILNFRNEAINMSLDLCDLIIAFEFDYFTIFEINCLNNMNDSMIHYC